MILIDIATELAINPNQQYLTEYFEEGDEPYYDPQDIEPDADDSLWVF